MFLVTYFAVFGLFHSENTHLYSFGIQVGERQSGLVARYNQVLDDVAPFILTCRFSNELRART